ncbi:hypothetical protein P691DRAFT_777158 [Macrolepiota fuliginosa MF-IS2]|uniref:Uncharacterized protein n=1 Tax=Macrolepiota fuliginosa MF-IS2 TaxID=1400762 RepID=A0A9P5XAF5_9AGAR|nr:hypothetical protein P691DRAFT_777158 [Macrolepiota fuliginosa MF-IS2]
MDMDPSLIANLPKLTDPKKYWIWARRVEVVLVLIKVQGSDCSAWDLCGNPTAPAVSTDAAELARRNILASQALAIISITLPDAIIQHGINDPRALRTKLHADFGTLNAGATYAELMRAKTWRISGTQNPSMEIAGLNEIFTLLALNGFPIDEPLRAMWLLGAIPPEWNSDRQQFFATYPNVTDVTWDRASRFIQTKWDFMQAF